MAITLVPLLTSCDKYKDIFSLGGGKEDRKQYDYHIVVSVRPDNSQWKNNVLNWAWKAREELEREYSGITVDVVLARDSHEQAMQLHTLSRKNRISALVIMADEPDVVAQYCREFRKKGTMVIAVHNNIVFQQCPNLFVSGDNNQIGYESAQALINLLGGKNPSGMILSFLDSTNPAICERNASFREVLSQFVNITIKEVEFKEYASNPYDAMVKVLQENSEIDAIWTGWDSILEDVLRAYNAEGRSDVKAFIGGNGTNNINKLILADNAVVPINTTYPPKMIYDAIMLAFKKLSSTARNEIVLAPPECIILPSEVITKDNAKTFINQLENF